MAPVSTSSSASHRRGDHPFCSGPQAGEQRPLVANSKGGVLSQVVQVQAGPQGRAPLKFDTLGASHASFSFWAPSQV